MTARKAEKSGPKRIELGTRSALKLSTTQTLRTDKGKRRFSGSRAANETGKGGSSTHRDATATIDDYDKDRLGASLRTNRSNKGDGSPDQEDKETTVTSRHKAKSQTTKLHLHKT